MSQSLCKFDINCGDLLSVSSQYKEILSEPLIDYLKIAHHGLLLVTDVHDTNDEMLNFTVLSGGSGQEILITIPRYYEKYLYVTKLGK